VNTAKIILININIIHTDCRLLLIIEIIILDVVMDTWRELYAGV